MARPASFHTMMESSSARQLNFLLVSFLGLGYVLTTLPEYTVPPPGYSLSDRVCVTGGWKAALILTHTLTFLLIPVAMRVFYDALARLNLSRSAVFASQLGLAFIMVAIAAEMGWHVTQCWYYSDDYTMLNFMFYFFLLSAFALWGDGMVQEVTWVTHVLNNVFAGLLVLVAVLYPKGYSTGNGVYKVPIYVALTLIFAVLTWRGWKLLDDKRIVWFPFFSVGVNLLFIYLLVLFGGDPYVKAAPAMNALFHILHDLIGTLLGVAIFTWLVYQKGATAESGGIGVGEQAPLLGR